jgi:hypothetical protein
MSSGCKPDNLTCFDLPLTAGRRRDAGLHETTFHDRRFRRAPRDGMDIGLDEAAGGAMVVAGRQLWHKSVSSWPVAVRMQTPCSCTSS